MKQTTTTNQVQIFAYGYVPKTNWWSLITKKISQKILACSAVVFFRRANILARESAILKLQSFSVMKTKRRLWQYEHKLAALAKEYWKLYFQPFPCLFGENRSQEGVVVTKFWIPRVLSYANVMLKTSLYVTVFPAERFKL